MVNSIPIFKGLDGVVVDETQVSKVDVDKSQLYYRGYNIRQLSEHASFLETAYLLLYGTLPDLSEFATFENEERLSRDIPESLYKLFTSVPKQAHPMDYLRLGVSYLGLLEKNQTLGDTDETETRRRAVSLFSKIPTILANGYRTVMGLPIIKPNKDLSYSENLLYMILGTKDPDDLSIKVFDTSLILYAEHGFNASTFSARLTASTLSDYYAAISSAIGTLKGPLHGGANEQVLVLLNSIASPDIAADLIRHKLSRKEKIMGFGHRLYRKGDSRVSIIAELGKQLADQRANHDLHRIGKKVQDIMMEEKNMHPNLDFPAAIAYHLLGIPSPLFTPLFVASRVTGWSAHILEQYRDNRLIRPNCHYVGHEERPVPPLSQR